MEGANDCWEGVSAAGELYKIPKCKAHAFAVSKDIKDAQNFGRALDPSDTVHQFCDDWQGLHNVRWLEKLDTKGGIVGWALIWGRAKHNLK